MGAGAPLLLARIDVQESGINCREITVDVQDVAMEQAAGQAEIAPELVPVFLPKGLKRCFGGILDEEWPAQIAAPQIRAAVAAAERQ